MGMNSTAPDLFGGELFGDELIDMYNSDAVVGANGKNLDVCQLYLDSVSKINFLPFRNTSYVVI